MIYQRNKEVVKRNIAGEVFLIPLRSNLADMRNIFVLHGIGEFIWDRLEGPSDADSVHNDIVDHFEVGGGDAKRDLDDHLAELLAADLVRVAREA